MNSVIRSTRRYSSPVYVAALRHSPIISGTRPNRIFTVLNSSPERMTSVSGKVCWIVWSVCPVLLVMSGSLFNVFGQLNRFTQGVRHRASFRWGFLLLGLLLLTYLR